ncbi:MAG: nicotinate (nicotinamide) nucleotide adenylyltransferase [Roseibacillus sp.]|jgi:nicotinate-nucleotide adenylyltransferase
MSQPLRIALFGGTFDPVHCGHLRVARNALEALNLDRIIFIPCRQSPHKEDGTLASEDDRLEMLHLALEDHPWAVVSEIEMLLPPPSYSWVTAEAMKEVYPEARLFWLMGSDQWSVIQSWARPDHLADLVEMIVHDRENSHQLQPGFRSHFIHGAHPASATAIRDQTPISLRSDWLEPKVERFIRSHGLYGC